MTLDQCIFSSGLVPSTADLLAIRDWLFQQGHLEVFSTSNFSSDVAVPIKEGAPIGGMLASCLSTLSRSYILWFKHPVSQTVEWAGDPSKSYSVEPAQGVGEVRLSPRNSFAKWQVSTEGQSTRWPNSALAMADRLHQEIFKMELRYTATLIDQRNKEFEQLTFAAAHDLQEPLRTHANFTELISECLDEDDLDELPGLVERLKKANSRMRDLVTDLLTYSSLVSENKREVIDLEALMSQVMDLLEGHIKQSNANIRVSALPTIRGDTNKLRQCLQNLLSNAIKYVKPGEQPDISIYIEQHGSFFTLNVKDNGIGIDAKYHAQIFSLFKRLHGRDEYEGTGIGLAICAKVAESMGADIGVESASGKGSTFWLRLHNSQML